jgi:ATP-binding cassette subfamily B protein
MRKLAPYLKPFAPMLLAVVGLLFVQAFLELNLPNYMSGIVNVGIQQSGIEHGAPSVISEDGMELMRAFMSEDEQALVDGGYGPYDARSYPRDYPQPGSEDGARILVKRTGQDGADAAALDDAFGVSAWTMINLMRDTGNGSGASAELEDLDFTPLYAELLPAVRQIPAAALEDAHARALRVPDSMRGQTAAAFAKAFYNELGVDVGGVQQGYIVQRGLIMLLIALVSAASSILVGFLSSRIAAGMARDLRRDLFQKVESFSLNEYNKFSTASLITRTTNDITQIQTFVTMGVRLLLFSPIMAVGGIIMALEKSVSMAWVIALAVIVILALIVTVFLAAMPKFKVMQKLIDKLNLVSRESLSGMLVIRAFGTQKHEEERFEKANRDLSDTGWFINKVMSLMFPVMMFIMNGVSLLIVWVGAHQIEQSALQVGDMIAYIQYAMIIIMSFLMIAVMFIMVPRASVAAQRIHEVLSTEATISDPALARQFDGDQRGVVEFRDVTFKYSGAEENVLRNISFTARPGQTTAFIGSTGSGKSTLVNLIPRFYDVTDGQVLVGGADVREVTQHALHGQIGYVPQKGMLFSGSIDSNIRYGARDASEADVERAAQIAQAMEFISSKEDGFQSPIAESGGNVSGGQKQRLSIARALAVKAPIYIFDDTFSALDSKTDANLRAALKSYTSDSTVLIVAQRVSTILHADQIIVLDDGVIVGKGTHERLMKDCPTYIEIAESQLGQGGGIA